MKPQLKIDDKQLNAVHHGGVTSGASTAFILLIHQYKAATAYAI